MRMHRNPRLLGPRLFRVRASLPIVGQRNADREEAAREQRAYAELFNEVTLRARQSSIVTEELLIHRGIDPHYWDGRPIFSRYKLTGKDAHRRKLPPSTSNFVRVRQDVLVATAKGCHRCKRGKVEISRYPDGSTRTECSCGTLMVRKPMMQEEKVHTAASLTTYPTLLTSPANCRDCTGNLRGRGPGMRDLFAGDEFFSSPIPGRPVVHWAHGSSLEIICEFWPEWDSYEQSQTRFVIRDSLEKKWIIYNRNRPTLHAVMLLGDVEPSDADRWQPVVKISLETTAALDWGAYVREGKRLFAEFCKIRLPGRPPGPGKPLRRPGDEFGDDALADLVHLWNTLQEAGCFTNRELIILTTFFDQRSQKKTAEILGISKSAVSQALRRMDARYKEIFGKPIPRRFSNRHVTGSGQRHNGRVYDSSNFER